MSTPGRAVLVLCGAVGFFWAGAWYNRVSQGSTTPAGARAILYYRDPMHPAYHSGKPGIAPDCGMQLEPVYAGGDSEPPGNRDEAPTGAVEVSPGKLLSVGIRTETVSKGSVSHGLRLLGRVTLDETRIYRVAAAVEGWVRKAGPIATGNIVQKDEVLATFYNRDFLTAQQTYLYALNTMDRFKDQEGEEQLKLTRAQGRAAEENLEFLGMGETQIQHVARTRQMATDIELRSPVAGLVLARNAFPGLRFGRGEELFRIADLNHIWILADVFENDAQLIRSAQSAAVVYQGRTIPVQISNALPQFDPASRALKVRLEMDNPNFLLRPDMFVDVEFQVSLPPGIAIPVDAVLDSGLRKSVFVDTGNGSFEPRQIQTGWRMGDRVEVTKGLEAGERIVVSGNFLLDSESRMKLTAVRPAGAAGKDPVCGMDVDPAQAAGKSEYRGKTYYVCSKSCKEKFDKNPEQYIDKQQVAHGAGDAGHD